MSNAGTPTTTEARLDYLATLSSLQYEKVRHTEANGLDIRVTALDAEIARRCGSNDSQVARLPFAETPEPWPEPVDGTALLGELDRTFARFVVLPPGAATAAALWVIHTFAIDAARMSPFLTITSPEKRCGKTTLLSVVAALVHRPLPASNVSPPALFRSIAKWKPTLLLDEAETFFGDKDALRGILNAGHRRGMSYTLRCVGDDYEPQAFNVFGAKAVALIGTLSSTLADRSIELRLRRRKRTEPVERLRRQLDGQPIKQLRRQCVRWVADNIETLKSIEPTLPEDLHDRATDNWEPLLCIADIAGGSWPQRARGAAHELSRDTDDETTSTMLLVDIRGYFVENPAAEHVPSKDLVTYLTKKEQRPWPEWRRGKPITPQGVAGLLKPFGIEPAQIRVGSINVRGYRRQAFEDVWSRYLPADPIDSPATPLQPLNGNGLLNNSDATEPRFVADVNRSKPLRDNTCSTVAPSNGVAVGTLPDEITQWPDDALEDAEERASIIQADGVAPEEATRQAEAIVRNGYTRWVHALDQNIKLEAV